MLYLDALTHEYVDEFSTSNFVAISKCGGKLITPDSPSVLPSITNMMLQKVGFCFDPYLLKIVVVIHHLITILTPVGC